MVYSDITDKLNSNYSYEVVSPSDAWLGPCLVFQTRGVMKRAHTGQSTYSTWHTIN